jgi:hypothetical protein
MSHSKVRAYSISTGAVLLIAAGAANSETQVITQGSAVLDIGGAFTVGNGIWTIQGVVATGPAVPPPSPPGGTRFTWGAGGSDIAMWYTPYPGGPKYPNLDHSFPSGFAMFDGFVPVTHAGTYTAPFTAQFEFVCSPCGSGQIDVEAAGSGSFTSTWAYNPNGGPDPYHLTGIATYTFQAPEPSTTALLLLGLAAVGFQVRARGAGRTVPH